MEISNNKTQSKTGQQPVGQRPVGQRAKTDRTEKQRAAIKRMLTGEVISDKMDKTVVVSVERQYTHPRLKKVMRTAKKYKVHDESESASMGDIVEIYEGRPLSKTKYMYLSRIIKAHS